jgi:hypothetical protein
MSRFEAGVVKLEVMVKIRGLEEGPPITLSRDSHEWWLFFKSYERRRPKIDSNGGVINRL